MPSCPNGHPVPDGEYCLVCGQRAEPAPGTCAQCGAVAHGLYCGHCGARARCWSVDIRPDREFFDRRQRHGSRFDFPARPSSRRVDLVGERVRIGRRSVSRQITPEIDLAEDPQDPAASREHAVLLAQPDGSWTVLDLGSANGTYVDGSDQRLAPRIETPVADGGRVHVGVWTTITLRCAGGSEESTRVVLSSPRG